MTSSRKRAGTRSRIGVSGIVGAAILLAAGASVAWLSFRTTLVRTLPPDAPVLLRLAPDDPDALLARATARLVTQHGILDSATLAAVRRAAVAAPLDARAYLILGHQHLLDGEPARAVATLEAGERLDPRQRLIHLLLLDRYLRTGRYAEATAQFSVLARLLGATQAPIAAAMARMVVDPQTRDTARRALGADPVLERAVMAALARADTAPDMLFALASPAARADARKPESWGPVLLNRLVARGDYAAARRAWQRIYAVPPARAGMAITNARFDRTPGIPPFDWVLAAGSLGAADLRGGSLGIDYYGRDSGDLARQLLVLAPGRYRFSVTIDAGKTDDTARLFWSLACGTDTASDTGRLMNLPVTATAKAHRIAADIAIPAGCPAQTLTLRGEAGDFPSPVSLTLRAPDIAPLAAPAPSAPASVEPTP